MKFSDKIYNRFFWAWWHIPIIPALRRVRQKDGKFEARLD
jgi:hypothetical protein